MKRQVTGMKKTQRPSSQKLRDELEDDIINGRMQPGERLDPEALAARFGVSRTPIREAIQQLVANRLVKVIPKRGTFVAEVGIAELIEMFEVMAELEGMCGRLAARRITSAQLQDLTDALRSCETAASGGSADNYYYENGRFHRCIYAASQNGFLATEAQHLHDRLKPYRRLQLRVRNRIQGSLAEHMGIVDAIAQGDEPQAEKLLREHVLVQGKRFSDLVASMGRLSEST